MVNLGTPLLGTLLPGTINALDNYGTFDDPINGPGCHDDLTKPPTGWQEKETCDDTAPWLEMCMWRRGYGHPLLYHQWPSWGLTSLTICQSKRKFNEADSTTLSKNWGTCSLCGSEHNLCIPFEYQPSLSNDLPALHYRGHMREKSGKNNHIYPVNNQRDSFQDKFWSQCLVSIYRTSSILSRLHFVYHCLIKFKQ
jgi:hypothetical protein